MFRMLTFYFGKLVGWILGADQSVAAGVKGGDFQGVDNDRVVPGWASGRDVKAERVVAGIRRCKGRRAERPMFTRGRASSEDDIGVGRGNRERGQGENDR